MENRINEIVIDIIEGYDTNSPGDTARSLEDFWSLFNPVDMHSISKIQQEEQKTLGTPVPVLKEIGKQLIKTAKQNPPQYLPLADLLWGEFGREGRVVAAMLFGSIMLDNPEGVFPNLMAHCRTCVTWEDADRIAMDGLEPVIRDDPEHWLSEIQDWMDDSSFWVRRAAFTVIGRLPMKHPGLASQCLMMLEPRLGEREEEAYKALSFAIRVIARSDPDLVVEFLRRNVPPDNPAATWVLCDVIRNMGKAILPDFYPLWDQYQQWSLESGLHPKDRRSVESALSILEKG